MPSDLADQVPLVREACEALGVPVLTFERLRSRRRHRHARRAGARRGASTSRSSPATRTSSSSSATASASTTRATRARGSTPPGVLEKFGVRPDQVVDVLALMGDSIDNIKGVPGIGEKGARELISAHGSLDALLAAAPTLPQKRYREALRRATSQSARESRELARIRTDVPVTFDPDALRYRGPSRERATRCSRRSDSGRSWRSTRRREDGAARLRGRRRRSTRWTRSRRSLRAPGRFSLSAIADSTSAVHAPHRRLVVFVGARIGAVHSAAHTPGWPTRRTCRRARSSPGSGRCSPIRPS